MSITWPNGMRVSFRKSELERETFVSLNGHILHRVSGEPVRGCDLVVGKVYEVDLSTELLKEYTP